MITAIGSREFIKTSATEQIQIECIKSMGVVGNSIDELDTASVRKKMFQFFETPIFKTLYFEMMESIADKLNLNCDNLILQTTPTPRVFKPGTHGTSFHCDYWYGHGAKSFTAWTPLLNVNEENTFYVCKAERQDHWYRKLECQDGHSSNLQEELMLDSCPVLPSEGESLVFDTKTIHGSPLNTSSSTRLSFDFRFGVYPDPTSTKDLENYFHYKDGNFMLRQHPLSGKKVLKYICGGANKNTYAQHMLIDAAATRYGFNLDAQEAEAERFSYPMLRAYLAGLCVEKGFEGIIIAGKSVLNEEMYELVRRSNVKVFSVLENTML